MTESIRLGEKLVPISPQPWARLKHRLPQVLSADELEVLADGDGSNLLAAQMEQFSEKVWRVLCILAPHVESAMPLHEWNGYSSPEAMKTGEYDDEAAGQTPSVDQIVEAFEVAMRINGVVRLGSMLGIAADAQKALGGAVPPASGRPPTPISPV